MSIGETGYDHFSSYSKNNLPNDYNKSQLFIKVENLLVKNLFTYQFDRGKVLDLMDIISKKETYKNIKFNNFKIYFNFPMK